LSVEWVEIGPHRLACGDCRDVMPSLQPVDAIVTDPPYGLEFMGKEWDHGVPSKETWRIALNALKPAGYMLCFGGTRTFHRMACAIEDAGFEIRDCLMWMYGQGFPKAKSCLKPAWEPVILARKPGGKVLPLGVDECRIVYDTAGDDTRRKPVPSKGWCIASPTSGSMDDSALKGRWPANVVHDGSDEVMEAFAAFGEKTSNGQVNPYRRGKNNIYGKFDEEHISQPRTTDTGTAARFYYCAKASKADRDEGLEGMPSEEGGAFANGVGLPGRTFKDGQWVQTGTWQEPNRLPRRNTHPTVKPTSLMEWLIKLVARPGETVLDPFAGSGSTLKACARIGRHGIGIEKHRPYWEIAAKRTEAALKSEPLLEGVA
jgi:DNA modification methylase